MANISITPAVNDPYIVKNLKVPIRKGKATTKGETKEKHPRIWAVDFDNTLCRSRFPALGEPNLDLINALLQAKLNGVKLILWTCREGKPLADAVEWCKAYGLYFDAINDNIDEMKEAWGSNPRKIFANLYIDDQAFPWWGDGQKGDLCKLQEK